ncbi:MAG: hypothetical protein IPI11_09670 [Haliscomenobacter sp.]|nr:hypothetical protein [Haliscomenobacter sp.]
MQHDAEGYGSDPYFTCDDIHGNYDGVPNGYEAWARIKRTFTATDCYGNSTQGWQYIYLVRPEPNTFGEIPASGSLKDQVASAFLRTRL